MRVHRRVYGTVCTVLVFSLLIAPGIARAQESEPGDPGDPGEPGGIGRPCDPNFFKPCAEGLVCVQQRCARPAKKKQRIIREVEAAEDDDSVLTSTQAG